MGIIPHKVIVNISLGVQYLHSKLTFKQALSLGGVFSGVMPLGVLAGHLLIHRIENKETVLKDACVLDLEVSSGTANPVECMGSGGNYEKQVQFYFFLIFFLIFQFF